MAATLADIDTTSKDAGFIARVRAAMAAAAVAVGNEARDFSQHSLLRAGLASEVLRDPDDWAPAFALAVAANPVITTSSVDGDIQFAIAERWDAIAGAGPVE